MSMPIPFNIVRYTRRLSAAGIPQEQAEAHASALAEVLNETPVALDADMTLLKADILARVQEMLNALEQRIDRRLAFLQSVIVAAAAASAMQLIVMFVLLAKLL